MTKIFVTFSVQVIDRHFFNYLKRILLLFLGVGDNPDILLSDGDGPHPLPVGGRERSGQGDQEGLRPDQLPGKSAINYYFNMLYLNNKKILIKKSCYNKKKFAKCSV